MEFNARYETGNFERVRTLFNGIDEDFYPPLSQRSEGLEKYLKKPIEQGNVVIVEKGETLAGVCAYDIEGDTMTVEIIGIEKEYRKTSALCELFKVAIEKERHDGRVKYVNAETWSTNYRMRRILGELGFKEIGRVEGDMIPDRTTIHYQANFRDIEEFLLR